MPGRYLFSLFLTLVLEVIAAYLLGFRKIHSLLAVVMINMITHPILNYLLLVFGFLGIEVTLIRVSLLEMVVVIAEWGLLVYVFGSSQKRLLLQSILANAASFLAGVLIFWIR